MEANYGNLDQVIGDVFFNLKEIVLLNLVLRGISYLIEGKRLVNFSFERDFLPH
jgi:hypothetical protein